MSKQKDDLEAALRKATQQLPHGYQIGITITRGNGEVSLWSDGKWPESRKLGHGPQNESLRDCVLRLLALTQEPAT